MGAWLHSAQLPSSGPSSHCLPPPPAPVQPLAALPAGVWDQPMLEPHLFSGSCLQTLSLYLGYKASFTR